MYPCTQIRLKLPLKKVYVTKLEYCEVVSDLKAGFVCRYALFTGLFVLEYQRRGYQIPYRHQRRTYNWNFQRYPQTNIYDSRSGNIYSVQGRQRLWKPDVSFFENLWYDVVQGDVISRILRGEKSINGLQVCCVLFLYVGCIWHLRTFTGINIYI